MNASERAVQFIASLSPQFHPECIDDVWHARNVESGLLVSAVPSPEGSEGNEQDEEDDPAVLLHFPHSTIAISCPARYVAATAVVSYVQFHGTGHSPAVHAAELRMLDNHFFFKTGLHLYLPSVPESESLPQRIRNSAMGQGLLTEALSYVAKRAFGLP